MRKLPHLALYFLSAAFALAADTSTFVTVDLSSKINTALDRSVLFQGEGHTNHLKELPAGRKSYGDVPFDVAGTIQLDSAQLHNLGKDFPRKVTGIELNQLATKIHLLHGTAWRDTPGRRLASLVLNYEDGSTATLDVIYAMHVLDWWELNPEDVKDKDSAIVWRGKNPQASAANATLRLYRTTFVNPKPGLKIKSIDYVSKGSVSAPFMVGLTLETQ